MPRILGYCVVSAVAPWVFRLGVGVLLSVLTGGASRAADVVAASPDLTREAKSLQAVCGKCHNLQVVTDTPRGLDEWRDTMQAMVDRGASGTDEQYDDILDYLHRTATTINVNSAAADELATVLNASDATVKSIIARRSAKKFVDIADLETVPGIDTATVVAKSPLLYFH